MTLRLSEAIRLGAMLSPQGIGGYTDGPKRCALAGACDALGIPSKARDDIRQVMDSAALESRYPMLMKHVTIPIGTMALRARLREAIWALNDGMGWTREAIADWVATIEAQQEQQPQETPALAEVV